jgi:hypothetical protein
MRTFLDVADEFGSNSLFILLHEPKMIDYLLSKKCIEQIIISYDGNHNQKLLLSNSKGFEYLVETLRDRGRLENTFSFATSGSHSTRKNFESYSIDERRYKKP